MAFSSFQARSQNQFLRGLLLLTMALTLHLSPARASETVEDLCGDTYKHLMLVPVRVSFEDTGIREESVYDALTPTLFVAEEEYLPANGTFDDRTGSKTYQFCVARSAYQYPLDKLKPDALSKATLQLGLSDVPLQLDDPSLDAWKMGEKNLRHAPILLTAVPTPDWLIATKAELLSTQAGDQILEIALLNPTEKGLLGPDVRARFWRPSGVACGSGGTNFSMDVKVTIDRGQKASDTTVAAYATDPAFEEFTKRTAEFHSNDCGGGDVLLLSLGTVRPVQGGNLVRYRWKIVVEEKFNEISRSASGIEFIFEKKDGRQIIGTRVSERYGLRPELDHFHYGTISLESGRVWPRTLEFSVPR